MDNTRDEVRKLIDVIEKGARSASVAQVIDDMKTFSNTASFLANTLDTRLKKKGVKPKMRSKLRKTVWGAKTPKAQHTKVIQCFKAAGHHNGHAKCNQHSNLAS